MNLERISHYFATARERYKIRVARAEGLEPPWTYDPIFANWRFCNVHREHDRTTLWFKKHIRDPLSQQYLRTIESRSRLSPDGWDLNALRHITEATLIFRWFNRIETGEILSPMLLADRWRTNHAREMLTGIGPVFTGAVITRSPRGYTKLNGILRCIDLARPKLEKIVKRWTHPWTYDARLETAWRDLCTLDYIGGFMAYEIVSDLRHTPVLGHATDINQWANAGPGAARGLSLLHDRGIDFNYANKQHQHTMQRLMRELLLLSLQSENWPPAWPVWEMREVEHWTCEYDKYIRARAGQDLKRRFP